MTDRTAILDTLRAQIEPFNKKGIAVTEATTFQGDLEWDSLTVMDFVAAIEDEQVPVLVEVREQLSSVLLEEDVFVCFLGFDHGASFV